MLALLVLLLQQPEWAQWLIDQINKVITTVLSFMDNLFDFIDIAEENFQLDASQASTWLLILVLTLGLSALIARFFLPGTASKLPSRYYTVTPLGRVLGFLLGAVNGFLIINLVREYLDGRNLPGSTALPTEITSQGGSSSAPPLSTLSIQAVNLPSATILDSYIPWLIVGVGFLILLAVLWTRIRVVRKAGVGTKIEYVPPLGYKTFPLAASPRPTPPQEVRIVS
ncbi:MAG TPA: hypothetical protein VEC93_20875 [Anaerolineae bacterium]|nr:hypothetical protein [Anaerolineae bacterium]